MTSEKTRVDWDRIEPGWRAGIKSVLQLAADYKAETGKPVSHTAINKHFKKLEVPRDLKAKIQAKAASLVSTATVSATVSTETTLNDALIINEMAKNVATVVLSERKDLEALRAQENKLMEELSGEPTKLYITQYQGEIVEKTVGLTVTEKASALQALANVRARRIELERKVWGIASEEEGGKTGLLDDILAAIDGTSKGLPVT